MTEHGIHGSEALFISVAISARHRLPPGAEARWLEGKLWGL